MGAAGLCENSNKLVVSTKCCSERKPKKTTKKTQKASHHGDKEEQMLSGAWWWSLQMKSRQTRSSRSENIKLLPHGRDATLLETLVLWLLLRGLAGYRNSSQPHFVNSLVPPWSTNPLPHRFLGFFWGFFFPLFNHRQRCRHSAASILLTGSVL